MIVSFHPLFEADTNIICAGRKPNTEDLDVIKAADAVILAQGCSQALYEMARANCPNVFPNYDTRFKYPGKLGQIKLFREIKVAHPASELFAGVDAFRKWQIENPGDLPLSFPVVFKLDWGGEGQTVFRINSDSDLKQILKRTAEYERSGQSGFLLQEYISSGVKTLRVVIIGQQHISYWRIQENSAGFYANLKKGAIIEPDAEPELQRKAIDLVKFVCNKTRINLAGFDVIFSTHGSHSEPLLLEINFFFGRKGLGGSEAYYELLQREIHMWLRGLGFMPDA